MGRRRESDREALRTYRMTPVLGFGAVATD